MNIGNAISRVRGSLKAVKQDTFITDRFLYSLLLKYGKTLIKREDNRNKVMSITCLFSKIPCINLIKTDAVEACCGSIKSGTIIMKSEDRIPEVIEIGRASCRER